MRRVVLLNVELSLLLGRCGNCFVFHFSKLSMSFDVCVCVCVSAQRMCGDGDIFGFLPPTPTNFYTLYICDSCYNLLSHKM